MKLLNGRDLKIRSGLLCSVVMMPLWAHADIFFSEYIEGSSNNKALELYNSGDTAVNLAGYKIEAYFNGSATANGSFTINLIGSIPAKGVFVVAPTNANATILAKANQTFGTAWFNGDDAIVLKSGTTIVDSIGQVGFDPGAEWGAGLASTADNTRGRLSAPICAKVPPMLASTTCSIPLAKPSRKTATCTRRWMCWHARLAFSASSRIGPQR